MPRPGDKFGNWTLQQRLDRGGQGQVFQATGGEGSQVVALKHIKADRVKKRERFIREIKAHAELTARGAKNVIPLLDSNLEELQEGGVQGYLVMPLAASSVELAMPMLNGRIELCLEVFEGIIYGVREAHTAGIIHRDLKPANILFLDTSLRTPLVTDFGICLLKETPRAERLTDEGETVGARFFMAPEQERGGISDVTEAADIYALGKLLHHMLTGRYVFREGLDAAFTPVELARDQRYQKILDLVLRRTLVENPADRIQSVDQLIVVFQELRGSGPASSSEYGGAGTPPEAPPPPMQSTASNASLRGLYESVAALAAQKQSLPLKFALDESRREFDAAWEIIFSEIKDSPDEAPAAARRLVESQQRVIAVTLAMARCDTIAIFADWKRLLEHVIRASEGRSGYPGVFTVPHVLGGFLYMAAAVQAFHNESWGVFECLLNAKFEWYYRSGRALYTYGFTLPYFFHPEALGRKGSKTHDLYRELLAQPAIQEITMLSGDDLLDTYLRAQLLMSLRVAQEVLKGNDARIWPDYGRFYSERVRPLFDRAHADPAFAAGIAAAFGETPAQFFGNLNERLGLIQKNFWHGIEYFWESLSSWEPR